jgi:hypothetical protein
MPIVSRYSDRKRHDCTNEPSDCLVRLRNPGFKLGHDEEPTFSPSHIHCRVVAANFSFDLHQCTLVDELWTLGIDGEGLRDLLKAEKWFLSVLWLRGEVEGDDGLRLLLRLMFFPTENGRDAPFTLRLARRARRWWT